MKKPLTRRDLNENDLLVLLDLVRFGVLADDQIARRYGDAAIANSRLPLLRDGGLILMWRVRLEDTSVYSPTTLGTFITRLGLGSPRTSDTHLAHDVAVVDLADYLLASNPTFEWRTEREVRRVLDAIGPPPERVPGDNRHRPDGLLLTGTQRIAIELEHSDKFEIRYIGISRWFARESRIDAIRWYVDNPKIIDRLTEIVAQHGFVGDIPTDIQPFPPGVRIRRGPGRFEP